MKIATPGIDRLDKTYFPTHKRDPLVLCHIIQTFMMGTIQEFYHMPLVQQSMIHYSTAIDALRIGANGDELDGNKRCPRLLESE